MDPVMDRVLLPSLREYASHDRPEPWATAAWMWLTDDVSATAAGPQHEAQPAEGIVTVRLADSLRLA
jgi:hypothetical protein